MIHPCNQRWFENLHWKESFPALQSDFRHLASGNRPSIRFIQTVTRGLLLPRLLCQIVSWAVEHNFISPVWFPIDLKILSVFTVISCFFELIKFVGRRSEPYTMAFLQFKWVLIVFPPLVSHYDDEEDQVISSAYKCEHFKSWFFADLLLTGLYLSSSWSKMKLNPPRNFSSWHRKF